MFFFLKVTARNACTACFFFLESDTRSIFLLDFEKAESDVKIERQSAKIIFFFCLLAVVHRLVQKIHVFLEAIQKCKGRTSMQFVERAC